MTLKGNEWHLAPKVEEEKKKDQTAAMVLQRPR